MVNPMEQLGWVDWLIVGIYLVGVVGLGTWLGRGQKTTRDYFLGSRSIPWWGVGLSIVATETSALTFIGVPALAYGGDLTFIQIVFGYVLARVLLAILVVPHYFRGEIYSPYELLAAKFGPGARLTAGGFFLVSATLAAGVRVYVTCIPLQLMLGFEKGEILWAILLFTGISLVYTYLGGIRAVVWTDVIQFVLLIGGGLFVLFYIPFLLEGGLSGAWQSAQAGQKLKWLRPEFSLDLPYNLWMGLIGALVMACATHGADQLIVQRVLTCRNVREGRLALLLSAAIILPLFLLFLAIGLLLWTYYRQVEPAIPLPETGEGLKQNDYIFPIFILTSIPTAVKGLMMVGILSAAMSSVSSALSALASVSTVDFFRRLHRRDRGEAYYFRVSRLSTLFWAAMLILVAYLSQQAASILNLAFSLNGLTSGAMLGGVILALICRRHLGPAVPMAMGVSLLVMAAVHFAPQWSGWKIEIAWPWYTLIGVSVTVLAWAGWQRFLSSRDPRGLESDLERGSEGAR